MFPPLSDGAHGASLADWGEDQRPWDIKCLAQCPAHSRFSINSRSWARGNGCWHYRWAGRVSLGKLAVGCNFRLYLNFGAVSNFLREDNALRAVRALESQPEPGFFNGSKAQGQVSWARHPPPPRPDAWTRLSGPAQPFTRLQRCQKAQSALQHREGGKSNRGLGWRDKGWSGPCSTSGSFLCRIWAGLRNL